MKSVSFMIMITVRKTLLARVKNAISQKSQFISSFLAFFGNVETTRFPEHFIPP